MERIAELLSQLASISTDELAELRGLLQDEYDRLDAEPTSTDNVAAIHAVVEQVEQVMAEQAGREQAQAEAEAAKTAARDRMAAINADPEDEPEEDPAAAPDPEAAAEDPEDENAADPAAPVAVTAGAVRRIAASQRRPAQSPERRDDGRNRAVLTASGALGGIAGKEVTDREVLGREMARKLERMPRPGHGQMGDVIVASATWEYPRERQLQNEDAWFNDRLIKSVCGDQALVASGGICSPGNVDYDVPVWADASRPIRDALPSFATTRGLLRYVVPPVITNLAGATGLWTAAMDLADTSTKALLKVACGNVVEVPVAAVTTRLGFGNMQGRFAPEQVAANTDLAIAWAARFAENNLLNLIQAQAILNVNNPVVYGATRDLITVLEQAVSGLRNTYRIPVTTKFTAILPQWLKGIVKIDLAREIGHAQSSEFNSLAITDQQVDDLLNAHGVNPVWHLDGQPASAVGGDVYPSQLFVPQAAGGIVQHFPATVVWYLFPEGAIQFLDGGRLDLGVVRDSVLDATNDYETFVETFEGIANRTFPGAVLQMLTTLCASGGTAGTVSSTGNCA